MICLINPFILSSDSVNSKPSNFLGLGKLLNVHFYFSGYFAAWVSLQEHYFVIEGSWLHKLLDCGPKTKALSQLLEA